LDFGIRGVRNYGIGVEGGINIMRIIFVHELLSKEFVPYD